MGGCSSPLSQPVALSGFSGGLGARNQSTETCADHRHREVALGLNAPRNGGKSDVRPGPWNHFAPVPKFVNLKKLAIPEINQRRSRCVDDADEALTLRLTVIGGQQFAVPI